MDCLLYTSKQSDELNDFVTNYLNKDRIKEYLSRKQGIDYKTVSYTHLKFNIYTKKELPKQL